MPHPALKRIFGPLRLLALLTALVVFVAACGDDTESDEATEADTSEDATEADDAAAEDDTEADDAEADEMADEMADEEEASTDDAAADEEPAEDAGEDTGAEAAEGQPVDLGEWFIEVGDVAAGTTTFALSNSGEQTHALAVARGTSYEELPQLDNGAVDTETLGDDFLGASNEISNGATTTVDFDLEPGDYVFFCPIAFGPNSHAARGQVLSVTVS